MRVAAILVAVLCIAAIAVAQQEGEKRPFPFPYVILTNPGLVAERAAALRGSQGNPASPKDDLPAASTTNKRPAPRILTTHVADLVAQMAAANTQLSQLGQKSDDMLKEVTSASAYIAASNTAVTQGFTDVLKQLTEGNTNIGYKIDAAAEGVTKAIVDAAEKISANDLSYKVDQVVAQLQKLVELIGP